MISPKERAGQAAYRAAHRKELRASAKVYYATHKDKCRAYAKTYCANHRDDKRAYDRNRIGDKRMKKYGLSPEAFDAMFFRQGGVCAVCGLDSWGRSGPVVDHDHATGNVRGILCTKCNLILGLFENNQARLRALAIYLKKKET